jgi:hypothetical protein
VKSRATRAILLVFGLLTLLVWGLFALDRGSWQDEGLALGLVVSRSGFLDRCLTPATTPTRVLWSVPVAISLLFPTPMLVLQLFYGATWLLGGLLIYAILRVLLPGAQWVAFVGGCVALTSTGDFLTDCLVSLGYEMCAVFYFTALICLLRWWRQRRAVWLLAAGASLAASVFTADGALVGVLLAPAFLWASDDFRAVRRRFLLTSACWYAVVIPYGAQLVDLARQRQSYIVTAQTAMGVPARIARTATLFMHNFNPWAWGPGRQNWMAAYPSCIPIWSRWVLAGLGGIAFGVVAWRLWADAEEQRPAGLTPRSAIGLLILSLLVALGTNGIFSFVQFADKFYRTQVISRYWAALTIAMGTYLLSRARLIARGLLLSPLVVFVGLGVYGGLDRQDYFLSYWLRHQRELWSIVKAVPRLRSSAYLVLYVPPGHPYLPVEAEYLADSWMVALYDDPSMWGRTFLWSPSRGSSCKNEGDQLVCQGEGRPVPERIDVERVVVLNYDPKADRFLVAETLPAAAGDSASRLYKPSSQIVREPPTRLAVGLLGSPKLLSRVLPQQELEPSFRVRGAVDRVGADVGSSPNNGKARAEGWALVNEQYSPTRVAILVDGRKVAESNEFFPRPDVSEALHRATEPAGWSVSFVSTGLSAGPHKVRLAVQPDAGYTWQIASGEAIVVLPR